MANDKYIAIGPLCYGIAETEEKAVRLMKKSQPYKKSGQKIKYRVFLCHPESTVSLHDGSISYPLPHEPQLVKEVGFPKGKS